VSTQPTTFLTPEEYLEIERKAEFKSEYYRGEMFAMAGAKWNHSRLVANLVMTMGPQILPHGCEVVPIDHRVKVADTTLYTYPDLTVVCGEPKFLDGVLDTLLNPIVLIEVLSPSTEAYDRGKKFELYRSISTLREYLMVFSDRLYAEIYTRQADGKWLLTSAERGEDILKLQSIGCSLRLSDVYRNVVFDTATGA
jgi:Uma2 family endonuclease